MFDSRDIHEDTNWLLGDDLDPVLQMRMAMLDLAGEDRDDWLAPALSDRVVEVLELRERLEAEVLRLIGRWDRARAWETDGSLSARSWLEHRAALAPTEARRMAKTARLVDRHDLIAEALADGRTTVGHVDVLSRTVSKPREPLLGAHEPLLVDHATALPVRDFAEVMRRWASYADDQLAADTHEVKWERRHLHASRTFDGWGEVLGSFDPAGYAAILNALDHLAPPDPLDAPNGPRSLAQRRADGLVDLANWYLGGGQPSGNPPNLSLIVDVAALNPETPEAALGRCELEGVGAVARATLEQLACCATVTRVVMAGESEVLEMGRAARLATPAQRRALAVRDRHCRFPGCRRVPQWCDAHHVISWLVDGPTDIDNLIHLCRRHHTLMHNSKRTITATHTGSFEFTHPARGP